jgi:hypothetical protein
MRKFLVLAPLALASAPAFAAGGTGGVDYTSLTSAVDFTSTITAILAVGALAVTLALAVKGVRKIMSMIRGA